MGQIGKFLVFSDEPYYPWGRVYDSMDEAIARLKSESVGGSCEAQNVYIATIVMHRSASDEREAKSHV